MIKKNSVLILACLFVLIFCLLVNIGIGDVTQSDNITPGELLIRLTPAAADDLKQLHSKSPIALLYSKYSIESIKPIFPIITKSSIPNSPLNRTYLLRFTVNVDLPTLKAAFEESELIEQVSYNFLRPILSDEVIPNDPEFSEQWSLPLIKITKAWGIEKGNPDVVIAIIDSGIDYRHDDLSDKIWHNPGEIADNGIDDDGNGYIDDMHGWDFTDAPNLQAEGDFIEGDNEPIDESGHGTHVAGIAGAMPDNNVGIAGVAWNCPLMAVRAGLSLGGSSRLQDDDSAAAIVYATDNGARIINMSWGSSQHSFVIKDAIDYAYSQGVVLIGAAGNSQEAESIFPAGYGKVISVASTNQHRQRYYKSNFGASVDIGAPGNAILSTQIGNRYRILTGTSMAAPHVAGIAALMLSKRPTLNHEEVRQILINTTDPIFDKDSEEPDPDLVGAGNVNAERALISSSVLQARIHLPQTNSGGSTTIAFVGTVGGYKFDSWQLLYGISSVPTKFIPITDNMSTQKVAEQLTVWDITDVPEDIYTVRLVVKSRDGSQTHDQVVLTVDRSPPIITSVTAIETLYGDKYTTVFSWLTDDFSKSTIHFRRSGKISPFSSLLERSMSKEHFFSIDLGKGQYQYYIEAHNIVGLKTIDDNGGKYYSIDVRGRSISPHGFIETSLGVSSLHIADNTADFDLDGSPEFVGSFLTNNGGLTASSSFSFYKLTQTGKISLTHSLTSITSLENLEKVIGSEKLIPSTIGDADQDRLYEILAHDKDNTYLIESQKPNDYPSRIVWETPFISGGKIADIDKDERKEIVGVDNSNNRILIFENRGNNQFDRTWTLNNETEGRNIYAKNFVIDDLDVDGKPDLLVGDSEGDLFIYTAAGNDSYRLKWHTQLGIDGITLLDSGDLTGDSVPEFVVGGTYTPPDIPSASPIWKFIVFTYKFGKFISFWEQAIAPYRLNGNSITIADLDADKNNELIITTYPNFYVFKWNGTTFEPKYHQKIGETPSLFYADLNNNGFNELYINNDNGLNFIESGFASNKDSVATITPWGLSAKPLTEKIVQVAWEITDEGQKSNSYTVFRAIGVKSKTPPENDFMPIQKNISLTSYLDRNVEIGRTYWYAVTAKSRTGIETERSKPVSATPRLSPKVVKAVFQEPNLIVVTFDRQMNSTISDERRYHLRRPNQFDRVRPMSAIRDKMGTRVLLVFDTDTVKTLVNDKSTQYEISVSNVTDIDENPLRSVSTFVEIHRSEVMTEIADLTQFRVYPNPVRPNISDKGAITFDKVPVGTSIQLFTARGELLEKLKVLENDGNSKEWWLSNASIGDIATGIYIYILEFENQKKVGKIAVIK